MRDLLINIGTFKYYGYLSCYRTCRATLIQYDFYAVTVSQETPENPIEEIGFVVSICAVVPATAEGEPPPSSSLTDEFGM